MITVEPALPGRCAFILLQRLDPSLALPTSETCCRLSNSTTLFFTGDFFDSLTPHLDIENRGKPRVTSSSYHASPIIIATQHQSCVHSSYLVSIHHYVSPFMVPPGYYLARAEFWGGYLFLERPLYCTTKPHLTNVFRFAARAIIIHFQHPFCLWQSAI